MVLIFTNILIQYVACNKIIYKEKLLNMEELNDEESLFLKQTILDYIDNYQKEKIQISGEIFGCTSNIAGLYNNDIINYQQLRSHISFCIFNKDQRINLNSSLPFIDQLILKSIANDNVRFYFCNSRLINANKMGYIVAMNVDLSSKHIKPIENRWRLIISLERNLHNEQFMFISGIRNDFNDEFEQQKKEHDRDVDSYLDKLRA